MMLYIVGMINICFSATSQLFFHFCFVHTILHYSWPHLSHSLDSFLNEINPHKNYLLYSSNCNGRQDFKIFGCGYIVHCSLGARPSRDGWGERVWRRSGELHVHELCTLHEIVQTNQIADSQPHLHV